MAGAFFPQTCAVYRPFGAAEPTAGGIPCRLSPDFAGGQQVGGISWTHTLDLPATADVRDGCTRSEAGAAVSYADGDEVRVGPTRYVVVWVERHAAGRPNEFRRAYLLRHAANWPDL
jgi:hypothetical protein